MTLRLEKFSLTSLTGNVAENAARRPYTPPSLVPEQKKNEPAAPPPPTFSETELKNAEQEGYRKGFLEGTKEGQAQAANEQADTDRKLTDSVAQLAARVHEVILQYNAFVAEQREELPKLALAVARKVAGDAIRENPAPLIEATVNSCVERLLGEPHIDITINSTLSDAMEKRLAASFSGNSDPGEINIEGDPDMPLSDCRIEWAQGKAERNTKNLWQDIEKLVESMIAAGVPKSTPAPDAAPPAPPIDPTTPNPTTGV